ncbi:O-methyltransferase [Nitrosomonas ureae]|uniref:Predicted O-methyltransferase YrrM n=1 Tax=Nitrosomonas ureae TaxID=44577 RepID=A0A286A4Y3_9PROT|nr:O-methyltransferase [Nitrosomonas ureae]PTQ88811.1 putative O-methyltransferase YrrM [Nitrosomonas ureae]PXX13967.1 putative O-methyltransferase YrrM [Nitrosomonas ureae]SOD16972.1 Predicted O-methyltransferase YrrM [Nitrosomonas ureae]
MDNFRSMDIDDSDGLNPVNPVIEAYLRNLLICTDHPVLFEMEEFARVKNFPIVNRLVGIFLKAQASMINAKRVFEFGSGYGYSAYWFAQAVGSNGRVICSDSDAANRNRAETYLSTADLWQRTEFHVGQAQDIFEQTEGWFDICYNDVDKSAYPEIWKMAKQRIRSGGLYIADNALWHGRVAIKTCADMTAVSESTAAIIEHNQMIFNDLDFDVFINPIRDGVLVARKK